MKYTTPKIPHEDLFFKDVKFKTTGYYVKRFPKELEEFLIMDLDLKHSKRYYIDSVYRFYIDNLEELKTDITPFIEFYKSNNKFYGKPTISKTYPELLEQWIEATKKPEYTVEKLYELCIKGALPKPREKYNKMILGSLCDEAKEEFNKGVKLSFVIRKYINKEDINTLCKTCNKPMKQLSNECLKCSHKNKQRVSSKDREIRLKESMPDYITISKGNLDASDFYNEEYEINCSKCKGVFSYVFGSRERQFHCPVCDKKHITSKEKEIALLIPNCTINNRKIIPPKEIDIYSEEFKFGIEYNGLVWHSSGYSKHKMLNREYPKKAHLNKTLNCKEQGVVLYQIFEDEWFDDNKRDIWVSKILGKQKLHSRIFARNCEIKEVSTKESREFLDSNHLQGYTNASIKIGLFYEDELVLICTINKSRYTSKQEYELVRLASKKYITVVGGASKVLKYFERNYKPKSIISYANLRWSYGDIYKTLGFEYSHKTEPNYFYFKKNKYELFSRIKFQKHKLKNLLEVFDENLTESENMYSNNYRKIYDCGNLVFTKTYE